MAEKEQDDQLEHTYSSSVRIQDIALKTCQRRRTIGRSGERGSGISELAARHEDDDDDEYDVRLKKSGMADHIWKEKGNHPPLWDEVEIIDRDEHWIIRRLKESAHMLGNSDLLSIPSIEMNTV